MCDVPLHYAEIDTCMAISAARISESYQIERRSAPSALLRFQGSGFDHLLVADSAHLHAGWVTNGIGDMTAYNVP